MYILLRRLLVLSLLILPTAQALADDYADTIKVFREAGESGKFFKTGYGYAVFPTIGKGGIGIGGAHGSGRVYAGGKYVGDTSMTQITVGLQLGGQGNSASASRSAGAGARLLFTCTRHTSVLPIATRSHAPKEPAARVTQ